MRNIFSRMTVFYMVMLLLPIKVFGVESTNIPEPKIKFGTVTITGKVIYCPVLNKENPLKITFRTPRPYTASEDKFYSNIPIHDDGGFELEFPIQIDKVLLYIRQDKLYSDLYILDIDDGMKCEIEIKYSSNRYSLDSDVAYTLIGDMHNYGHSIFGNLLEPDPDRSSMLISDYRLSPDECADYFIDQDWQNRLSRVEEFIPDARLLVDFIADEVKLIAFGSYLKYELYIKEAFRAYGNPEEVFTPQKPTNAYYLKILQELDLNNSRYLYYGRYFQTIKNFIFADDYFNLRHINNTPVQEWLDYAKSSLVDVVGLDSGLFYDMLVAVSYSNQMNDDTKYTPLNGTQRRNITEYYGAGSHMANILFAKSDEATEKLIERLEDLERTGAGGIPSTIHELPAVPSEELLEAIVSDHSNKAVIVDFWGTWCGPCITAFKDANYIKQKLGAEQVAYIYIADQRSSVSEWERIISNIGGEHYKMSDDDLLYSIMEQFDLDWAFPSYLVFDKQGNCVLKHTGIIDKDELISSVEKLIK